MRFLLVLLSFFSTFALSQTPQNSLLPAEEAFKLSADIVDQQAIFDWKIAKGYYLYKEKFKISTDGNATIGKLLFPSAIMQEDEFFGTVGIYRNQVKITAPIQQSKDLVLNFALNYQGCADIGVCYPPITQKVQLSVPRELKLSNLLEDTGNLMVSLKEGIFGKTPADKNHPLAVEKAFKLDVSQKDNQHLSVKWQIQPDYYLYKDKLKFFLQDQAVKTTLPAGEIKQDEFFGRVEVYRGDLEVLLPITKSYGTLNARVDYQGCWDGGVCYPPQRHQQNIAITSVTNDQNKAISSSGQPDGTQKLSEEQDITRLLSSDSILWSILAFFGFGALLSLTPCVFPMVPILSGILIGQKSYSTTQSFLISLIFVLTMSLVYAIAGAFVGLGGANLQTWLQTPFVLAAFSLIFVVLALSMFGLYDIALPKKLQDKLNTMGSRHNGYVGAGIMGGLSALIVGPCVAPPLAGALIYIGQTGDALLGGSALFFMGLGTGIPLLLLGASAGKILPKAGAWMQNIKTVFGILMLGVAIYLLERVLDERVILFLWASLFTLSVAAMGVFKPLSSQTNALHGIAKGLGFLIFGYGVLLFLLVAKGGGDMFSPLSGWAQNQQSANKTVVFQKVGSQDELNNLLQKASTNNQLTMLDFYADWCVTCKEMEKYLFTKPAVVAALEKVVLIKADVTKNTKEQQALMKAFGVVGPPALLFFKNKTELRHQRLIGEIDQKVLLSRLQSR